MLLLCRPMLEEPIGTLVMPGSLAPKNIGLCMTTTSKYMPYVIKDEDLRPFLERLYNAVCSNEESMIWPSGMMVRIDCIILASLASLCIPQSQMAKVDYEAYLWREATFSGFEFAKPHRQHSTVDTIINGVRVQDKVAIDVNGRIPVSIHKRLGKGKQPYHVGDFDALFVFTPGRENFFFIPAKELEDRGYLASPSCKGKQTLHIYTSRYSSTKRKENWPDQWSLKYCFVSNDLQGFRICLDGVKFALDLQSLSS